MFDAAFSVIVINGYKLIQEALKHDVMNGRPNFEGWRLGNGGIQNRGILFTDANSNWNEQRRFALRNLRDFGFGKESNEAMLVNELEELIKYIKCVNL
jgi:cytochrome P450 family 2 subfamily U polypeptide 1